MPSKADWGRCRVPISGFCGWFAESEGLPENQRHGADVWTISRGLEKRGNWWFWIYTSIHGKIKSIRQIIKVKGKVNFLDLFDDISKPYVIITFLSILNMTKNKEIKLSQTNNFGEIYIEGSTLWKN